MCHANNNNWIFAYSLVSLVLIILTSSFSSAANLVWHADFENQQFLDTFLTAYTNSDCSNSLTSSGFDSVGTIDYLPRSGNYSLRYDSCIYSTDSRTNKPGCPFPNLYFGDFGYPIPQGTMHPELNSSVFNSKDLYIKYWVRFEPDNDPVYRHISPTYLDVDQYGPMLYTGFVGFIGHLGSRSGSPLTVRFNTGPIYSNPSDPYYIHDGRWHKLEFYINYNSSSIKSWIDNTLIADYVKALDRLPPTIRLISFSNNLTSRYTYCTSSPVQIDDFEVWNGMPTLSTCASGAISSLCECQNSSRTTGYCLNNVWGPSVFSACVPSAEICNDNMDNDCDGLIDCSDSNCVGRAGCNPVCTTATLSIVAQESYSLYFNGEYVGHNDSPLSLDRYSLPIREGNNVVAVNAFSNTTSTPAFIANLSYCGNSILTDTNWKITATKPFGWNNRTFDATSWQNAVIASAGSAPSGINPSAQWIWTPAPQSIQPANFDIGWFRRNFTVAAIFNCDSDNDGYNASNSSCTVHPIIDCNDSDSSIHPGATEICSNSVDEDCSGSDSTCSACTINSAISSRCLCAETAYNTGYCCTAGYSTTVCPICGDGTCNGAETFISCPQDCNTDDVIIDNGQTGTSSDGTWGTGGYAGGYNNNYLYSPITAGNWYQWTTGLQPGTYLIRAYWQNVSGRPTNAQYQITHSTGTSNVNVDQTINGGQWNILGTYTFGTTGTIRLISAVSSEGTCADAVRFTITTPPINCDADNDLYNASNATCTALPGQADCNDTVNTIHPGATETCNGIDDDCNGIVDNGLNTTYYRDTDTDTYGNLTNNQSTCLSMPAGFVINNLDCNDNDVLQKPGQIWYKNLDHDRYSDGTSLTQCFRPANYNISSELTATTGDCNDNNPTIYPGATEVCNNLDDDCNSVVDNGLNTTYYRDFDTDTYGNLTNNQSTCLSMLIGYVSNSLDCNDNDVLQKPGQVWFKDVDHDRYSDGISLTQCLRPTNYNVSSELLATTGDCNDANAAIHPGAAEVCNNLDDDCNGVVDNGLNTTYYRDADTDTYGNLTNNQSTCLSMPAGFVINNLDCNDNDVLQKPGQIWYKNLDHDRYSDGTSLTQCFRPANYNISSELTATTGDCNDNNANIHPDADEQCNDIDDNCDNIVDEEINATYYKDEDGDNYSDGDSLFQCSKPMNYALPSDLLQTFGDCDDNNQSIWRYITGYIDFDGDTNSSNISSVVCSGNSLPSEYSMLPGSDCNDSNASIWQKLNLFRDADSDGYGNISQPIEVCHGDNSTLEFAIFLVNNNLITNGNDCNDNNPMEFPGQLWYQDNDGDNYTDGTVTTSCLRPNGLFAINELNVQIDCDDDNGAANPGATEICSNGADDDCVSGDLACSVCENNVSISSRCLCNGNVQIGGFCCGTYWQSSECLGPAPTCTDSDGGLNPSVIGTINCGQTLTDFCYYNDELTEYYLSQEPSLRRTLGINETQTFFLNGTQHDDIDLIGVSPNGYVATINVSGTVKLVQEKDLIEFGNLNIFIENILFWTTPINDSSIEFYTFYEGGEIINDLLIGCSCRNGACYNNIPVQNATNTTCIDLDGDGYGNPASLNCYSNRWDCNDLNASISPSVSEVCDGIDNDCNGNVDGELLKISYLDSDGDGFGNESSYLWTCSNPLGYVSNDMDCDDNNPTAYLWATETCSDGIDQNCDGYDEICNACPIDSNIDSRCLCQDLTIDSGYCCAGGQSITPCSGSQETITCFDNDVLNNHSLLGYVNGWNEIDWSFNRSDYCTEKVFDVNISVGESIVVYEINLSLIGANIDAFTAIIKVNGQTKQVSPGDYVNVGGKKLLIKNIWFIVEPPNVTVEILLKLIGTIETYCSAQNYPLETNFNYCPDGCFDGACLSDLFIEPCVENWTCTGWSGDNCGIRTCTDLNNCSTTVNKPTESADCGSTSSSAILVPIYKGGGGGSPALTPMFKSGGGFIPAPKPNTTTACNDTKDNENNITNGCIDSVDFFCGGKETSCNNLKDDDCDIKIDCIDSDCENNTFCVMQKQNISVEENQPINMPTSQTPQITQEEVEKNKQQKEKAEINKINFAYKQMLWLLIIPLIALFIVLHLHHQHNRQEHLIHEHKVKMQQLRSYLQSSVTKGIDLQVVKQKLANIGWTAKIVDKEMQDIQTQKEIKSQENIELNSQAAEPKKIEQAESQVIEGEK